MFDVQWKLNHPTLVVGVLSARPVSVEPASAALSERLEHVVARRAKEGIPPAVRTAIRDVLRRDGYKPTGRGKPASEYLLGVAKRGDFPRINNLVDINNLISLETGWPSSILDAERAIVDGEGVEIRVGTQDERYIFNASGQEMTLGGLPGLASLDGAMVGNAVKDSMTAKTDESTNSVVLTLWASLETHTFTDVERALVLAAFLLEEHAGAKDFEAVVLAQGERREVSWPKA